MNIPSPSIVGTGLFALDVILRPDGSATAPTLGGSAGNVLCILGALGWSTTPIGVLGKDGAANVVWRDFAQVDADMRFMMQTEGRSTPVIYQHQLRHEQGATHRFTFACPICGERRRPFWDCDDRLEAVESELPTASVFFLDRPTKLGVKLAEQYSAAGAMVVFEPSAVGDDVALFARALRCADIVKYAEERFEKLDTFELARSAIEIQTRGSEGLRFRVSGSGDDWVNLHAYDLPYVQDTSGAGDWCTAGLMFELFRHHGEYRSKLNDCRFLMEALAFGQALSTLNCMTEGARGLLSAWSTDSIVKFAEELREVRLQTVHLNASDAIGRVNEPRLSSLIEEFVQHGLAAYSGSNSPHCCTAS